MILVQRALAAHARLSCCRYYSSTSVGSVVSRNKEPLRILFCGSDEFSIASLEPLVDIKTRDSSLIESINVLCRPDKRVGSGLKRLNEVPIKKAARDIGLPIHQIDSFKEYDPTKIHPDINLIIAVSFGLLIPANVIASAKFGGLNVHPSLLPDLRGAAPIHYAILNRRSHTGVSVQTLHPTKFDHGQILAQTPLPGIAIPDGSTPASLLHELATEGARLLKSVVETRAYLQPLSTISQSQADILQITDGHGIAQAPRFHKSELLIDWTQTSAADIVLRHRVFGRLWDDTIYKTLTASTSAMRIIFEEVVDVTNDSECRAIAGERRIGQPLVLSSRTGKDRLVIPTVDHGMLEVTTCTIASKKPGHGKRDLLQRIQ